MADLDRRRLTVWLALCSLGMWTATVNITNFAARPSSPQEWLSARNQDANDLAQKLMGEAGDQRMQDWDNLVWLLQEYGNRQKAHDESAAMPPIRPDPSGYDAEYVSRLQRLARAELMHDCVNDMLVTLQHIYEYDKKYLPAEDIRISRDYNNLGLVCLLVGQSSEDEALRSDLFAQSNDWLHKAESSLPASARGDILSVQENELMLAEACKNRELADHLRQRVDALRAELNGPAPQVTL